MADRYYQVGIGGNMKEDVTEAGASSAGVPFELRITYDATGANKMQALKALSAMTDYITQDTWPPV